MDRLGVIHGRFQPLHYGHMEYLLAGKSRCEHLIIGISNPDEDSTRYNAASPHRSTAEANPCTYYERCRMIECALQEAGVPREEFTVVPFPVNVPERLFQYAPRDAKYYMTVYDDWGREKLALFTSLGLDVEVMWTRTDAERHGGAPPDRRGGGLVGAGAAVGVSLCDGARH